MCSPLLPAKEKRLQCHGSGNWLMTVRNDSRLCRLDIIAWHWSLNSAHQPSRRRRSCSKLGVKSNWDSAKIDERTTAGKLRDHALWLPWPPTNPPDTSRSGILNTKQQLTVNSNQKPEAALGGAASNSLGNRGYAQRRLTQAHNERVLMGCTESSIKTLSAPNLHLQLSYKKVILD